MVSMMATDVTWRIPFFISSLPAHKLLEVFPGTVISKEPVVLKDQPEVMTVTNVSILSSSNNGGGNQVYPVDSHILQAYVVGNVIHYDTPANFSSDTSNQEDHNNFGGALNYTVSYPSPSEPGPLLVEMPVITQVQVVDSGGAPLAATIDR
jgi:hypothetical protein